MRYYKSVSWTELHEMPLDYVFEMIEEADNMNAEEEQAIRDAKGK